MAYIKQNFSNGEILTAENLNLMEDGILAKQDIDNLTTTLDKNSDHAHYPSAKAVWDALKSSESSKKMKRRGESIVVNDAVGNFVEVTVNYPFSYSGDLLSCSKDKNVTFKSLERVSITHTNEDNTQSVVYDKLLNEPLVGGEYNVATGKIIKNYKKMIFAELSDSNGTWWSVSNASNGKKYFQIDLGKRYGCSIPKNALSNVALNPVFSNILPRKTAVQIASGESGIALTQSAGYFVIRVCVPDDTIIDSQGITNYMANTEIAYELATPEEIVVESVEMSLFDGENKFVGVNILNEEGTSETISLCVEYDKKYNSAEEIVKDSESFNKVQNIVNGRFPYSQYNVPVVELYGDISLMTKETAVELNYIYGERRGTCTLKWQGSSSLAYPKKNYTIKFDNKFEAKNGWGEQKKYCLKADWIDPSHCRNVVSAKLWGEIVHSRTDIVDKRANLPNGGAVDGFPCFVVINGEWQGVYNFNIPKDEWTFDMDSSENNHAILCANNVLNNSNGTNGTNFTALATITNADESKNNFEIESDNDSTSPFPPAAIEQSLNRLIQACLDVQSETDMDNVTKLIDINSVIDYYIFAVLIRGIDICSKNYILSTYDGNKWFYSAYDLDCVFGLHWDGSRFIHSAYTSKLGISDDDADISFLSYSKVNKLMGLLYTYKKQDIVNRYKELRNSVLSPSNIMYKFSNYMASVPRTAFDADVDLWKTTPCNHGNDVHQIVTWYKERVKSVDEEIALMDTTAVSDAILYSPLYGKKIGALGDAICNGNGNIINGVPVSYVDMISKNNGMSFEKRAWTNATITTGNTTNNGDAVKSLCEEISNMSNDSDYIIIEGGLRDAERQCHATTEKLGEITNTYYDELDTTTFYGAFESMLRTLVTKFAGKKYGYIAIHAAKEGYSYMDNESMSCYWAAKKCCAKWGVPFLDLNISTPPFGFFRSKVVSTNSNYELANLDLIEVADTYTIDDESSTETDIHAGHSNGALPNGAGYEKYYVPKIEAWLKTL